MTAKNKFNKSYSNTQLYYLNKTLLYINDAPNEKTIDILYKNQIIKAIEWCVNNKLEYNNFY